MAFIWERISNKTYLLHLSLTCRIWVYLDPYTFASSSRSFLARDKWCFHILLQTAILFFTSLAKDDDGIRIWNLYHMAEDTNNWNTSTPWIIRFNWEAIDFQTQKSLINKRISEQLGVFVWPLKAQQLAHHQILLEPKTKSISKIFPFKHDNWEAKANLVWDIKTLTRPLNGDYSGGTLVHKVQPHPTQDSKHGTRVQYE